MKASRMTAPWIHKDMVTISIKRDYSTVKDPATRKRWYVPKIPGSSRHLGRMFEKAERAVEYRDEVVRRCWRWKGMSE